jgi:hypothetical protein
MTEKTVLFYGSNDHPVLEPLYQAMRARGLRRMVFVSQERFPREIGIRLGARRDDPAGVITLPHGEEVDLDEICGVCLDGYYVDAARFSDLEPADAVYAQTETWALLIALFGRLSRRPDCVVANHVTRRERIASRAARLAELSRAGLRVPATLVTSDPDAARAFCAGHGSRTLFKRASLPLAEFKRVGEDELERLDAVRLAPVHFEEEPVGDLSQCVVVGERVFGGPDPAVGEACRAVCRALDLELAEVSLRSSGDGGVVATGLLPHLSPHTLHDGEILEAVCGLLEGGE